MIRLARPSLAALLLLPSLALASVGKVSALEGGATRTPKSGPAVELKVGSEVEVGDTLRVKPGGNMKLTFSDSSVLMLGGGSELWLEAARFEGLERKGVLARLGIGKVWAKVTKALAGSDARFEVHTDRAVAGVRGTIFRVDATRMLDAARPGKARTYTVVRVAEGKVRVDARRVSNQAKKESPPELLAQVGLPTKPDQKPGRRQVPGPTQVSLQEWEARFTELQARRMVAVGDELWHEDVWEPERDDDAFARFVKKHESSSSEPSTP